MTTLQRGYSLIELMVVVAIVGIIAAVAYPSYRSYTCDTYRSQARADLSICALAMERHFGNGFTYAGAVINGTAATVCPAVSPGQGPVRFDITLDSASQTDFAVQAAPRAGSGQESCGVATTIQITADGSVSEI